MEKYDAIIIGFGKGGKTLAADLANRGWNVAIIERSSSMYGGTCINIGCIPTKALVHLAKVTEYRKPATFKEYALEYREAMQFKKQLIEQLRQKNFENLDGKEMVTIYTGEASFRSPYEIEVKTDSETFLLEGKKIFINTGASTVIPSIPGIENNPFVYTSTSLLELEILPRHLVIVGGGYIGLEFASIFAGFGAEVTVLEAGDTFIPREDRDIAAAVQQVLQKKGVKICLNASVEAVERAAGHATVVYQDRISGEQRSVDAEAVLLAIGRRPYTQGLNLEAAGVRTTERGAIEVDGQLHTNVPHIWAIGDVRGGLQFTYLSLDDYRIIRDELFGVGKRRLEDRVAVPYTVFIDPPLSHIGLTEAQAQKAGKNIRVASLPASTFPRTKAFGQTDGLLKTVVDADNGQILGCTLFCAESSEVINTVGLAMRAGLPYIFLRDAIYTHPSMSESLNDLFSLIK